MYPEDEPAVVEEKPKLCVDCRHAKLMAVWNCERPNHTVSLVTGERLPTGCVFERATETECGPEGKHWEPKE